MSQFSVQAGTTVNITATGDVTTADCALIGFYVNSTNAGTLVLRKGGSSGVAISGTITPAIGYHAFPALCPGGLHATKAGTAINVNFFVVEGMS